MPPATMSAAARQRLKLPRTRGAFQAIDAARRQLGLLSVADGQGQARIYWLVDLATRTIADARFLAFGDLTSHPVADAFTELVRARSVEEACRLDAATVEAPLRDQAQEPAFGTLGLAPLDFLRDLQARALAELPLVKLLEKPEEKPLYQRKRKQDWTPEDERWFTLSLLRKIARIDAVAGAVLRQRLAGASLTIEGLHDDFRVVMLFAGLEAEQVPTVAQFIQDALHDQIHRQLMVDGRLA
jgi:NifU-like protein involved in Fe-S cluster formation